jgi:hypothetical protein
MMRLPNQMVNRESEGDEVPLKKPLGVRASYVGKTFEPSNSLKLVENKLSTIGRVSTQPCLRLRTNT